MNSKFFDDAMIGSANNSRISNQKGDELLILNVKRENFMKNILTVFLSATIVTLLSVSSLSAQYVCQRGPNPIQITGSINAGDVQQAGRITRDGEPSSCTGDTAAMENNTTYRRDTHQLTNPYNEIVCVKVEVDFTGCGGNQTQSVAYSNFNPANPAANVIGDMGYSTINKGSYSFSVGPNANFAIGVNEVEQNTGCPLYKLKVTYMRNCRRAGLTRRTTAKPTRPFIARAASRNGIRLIRKPAVFSERFRNRRRHRYRRQRLHRRRTFGCQRLSSEQRHLVLRNRSIESRHRLHVCGLGNCH
jgi:hypothetical protein